MNRPLYMINPVAFQESFWAPDVFQLILGHKNKNYLNSLWLGTGWIALSLPQRVLYEVVLPLVNFRFGMALISCFRLPASSMLIFWNGICGTLGSVGIGLGQIVKSIVLTPKQSQEAFDQGYKDSVLEIFKINLPI